jgi:demethylmenaquinone methyltransferase/2-methoxy-6-polyprenyl-1,4-benzoquinol methylase
MNWPSAAGKRAYVNRMFAAISPNYDLLNRLLSGGRDMAWRRYAVQEAALPRGGWLLDVATGTGDVALEVLRQVPGAHVVGTDFTLEMMRSAQTKAGGCPVSWNGGDALCLPFPDNTFDAAISAFIMRNVVDIPRAFAEQRRVVRPGGRVVCLEICRPTLPVFRTLFNLYFYRLTPIIGGLISGHPEAYIYLPDSLAYLPSPEELVAIMESVGLRQVRYRRMTLGTVALHVGVK